MCTSRRLCSGSPSTPLESLVAPPFLWGYISERVFFMNKKFFISLISFALVFAIIFTFPLTAFASPNLDSNVKFSSLTDFDNAFYCFGLNNSKCVFYNGQFLTSGYGEPLSNYWSSNIGACEAFKDITNWNGRQSYFYLPATNTSTSGKYEWSGRLWFSSTDNNDYHRDDWSGKSLSSVTKTFISIPSGQSLYCRLFFALPQLNYNKYKDFLSSNITLEAYSTDYNSIIQSDVKLFSVGDYKCGAGAPYGGFSLVSCQFACDFTIASVNEVSISSFHIKLKGISEDYGGVLFDNMMLFVKVTDDDNWGYQQIELNWFQKMFKQVTDGLNNIVNSITNAFIGIFSLILSGDIFDIANNSVQAIGNIIISLFNLSNVRGSPIPYV